MELKQTVLAGLCLFALTQGAAIDETAERRSHGQQDTNPLVNIVSQLLGMVENDLDALDSRLDQLNEKVESDVDDLDLRLGQLQSTLDEKVDSPLKINCHWKTTASDDDGDGKTHYLDRHVVDCGTDFLAYLYLQRPSADEIQYKYKCCSIN